MDWLNMLALSIVGSLLAAWIYGKLRSRNAILDLDDASLAVLEIALSLLPKKEQEVYRQEWFMFLCDQERALDRLKHAVAFVRGAAVISSQQRILVPVKLGYVATATWSIKFARRFLSLGDAIASNAERFDEFITQIMVRTLKPGLERRIAIMSFCIGVIITLMYLVPHYLP